MLYPAVYRFTSTRLYWVEDGHIMNGGFVRYNELTLNIKPLLSVPMLMFRMLKTVCF